MAKVLGIRCSNSGYSYVVLEGPKSAPQILACDTVASPKGYATPLRLGWMYQEVADLCKRHAIDRICMKGAEGLASRNASFAERIEMEAMVFHAGHQLSVKPILKKVKSTLAKDLGLKGKAKYLSSIDLGAVPGLAELDEKEREAGLAAWSAL